MLLQGGEIGKDFPPQLVKCMKHMSSKTAETIQAEYGYPNLRMADAVRNRSRGGAGVEGGAAGPTVQRLRGGVLACSAKWRRQ